MKKIIFVALLILGTFSNVFSQENDIIHKNNFLRVYLDQNSNDNNYVNYLKVHLWYVNYVRDPKQSQVHIFINTQPTASGGLEYNIRFIGKEKFEKNLYTRKKGGVQPFFIDAEDEYESLWTRFLNHAPLPYGNVHPKSIHESYDGKPRVWFVANRNIDVGEEICFDYGDDYWLEGDDVV